MKIPEKVLLLLTVGLGLAILAVALFGEQGLREVRRLRAQRRGLAAEIEQLKAQRDALEREIVNLRESPRAIEARARKDLGMIQKGETVFLLPEHHDPKP